MGYIPAVSTPTAWQPSWPEFYHPSPATLLGIAFVLVTVVVLVVTLARTLHRRVSRHRSAGFVVTAPSASANGARPTSLTSELEIESRQLLFPDRAEVGERLPLNGPPPPLRGSVYDTFHIPPPPHGTRLKASRSMMEIGAGGPLGAPPKNHAKKSKTIHWHGVNQLNTAWGWMT